MPVMHFAFGALHREQNFSAQVESFLEHILLPKQLRSFVCPEFHPIINNSNGVMAVPDSVQATGDGGITFNSWVKTPNVILLPNNIWMISFVDVPFKKLRSWKPADHYGHLGIAFTDDFRRRVGVRRVDYYQYPNLALDPLVIELHNAVAAQDKEKMELLRRKVIEYRKPARLWAEINDLFAALKVTGGPGGEVSWEKLTYSRYEVGYNFEDEKESRIVTTEEDREVSFSEREVLAVVVPNAEIGAVISGRLQHAWSIQPKIMQFPV